MVDADIVLAKLSDLDKRLLRSRATCPASECQLAADQDAFDIVSFNLILATQTCLDIASHLISDQGWQPASTLAQAFVRLEEHGVIAQETAVRVKFAERTRNILTEFDARAEPSRVFHAATEGLQDLESFAQQVGSWLRRRMAERKDL